MKGWIFCILLGTLSACGSRPLNVNYYVLSSPQAISEASYAEDVPQILVMPLILADYLKQSSMVMQLGDNQMYFSRQDVWAERLENAILKNLLNELNTSKSAHYRAYPAANGNNGYAKLTLQIDYFHATDRSTVVAAGRYWLMTTDTQEYIEKTFYFSQALTQDGYAHAVSQLRQLITALANDIQQNLDNAEILTN